jgi:predicted nucleic acid-binding protein
VAPDRYLLDTSAIMAFLEGEPGAERVEDLIRSGQCYLPWTVLLETTYVTRHENGEAEADFRYAMLKTIPASIVWAMDEPTLLTAARIKADHRLSLADALIAAYASQLGFILVHKDPEFESLSGQIVMEYLPYK